VGDLIMAAQNLPMAAPLVEFGVWTQSMANETENGDSFLVKPTGNGVLLAVIDGVGHGPEAAVASRTALSCIENYSGQGVIPLLQQCHLALKRTRGAVMNLAFFNGIDSTLTWLGVGNVEGVLLRSAANATPSRENILLRGGVVGLNLPPLNAVVLSVSPGDTLVFATDGIFSNFSDTLVLMDSPQKLVDKIGGQFCKGTDDALVVAGRYCGR
jgi:negative regulator of sigma-B (phosphoserine phosphatase)